MKPVWRTVNIGLVLLAPVGGYAGSTPEKLRTTNPDAILCLILLVLMPLFALGCVSYSVNRWQHDTLRRFSWDRNPMNWWHDPLQSLFITTLLAAAYCLGLALRFPSFGSIGFWTLGMWASLAVGLFIGQILVYRIYRERLITV